MEKATLTCFVNCMIHGYDLDLLGKGDLFGSDLSDDEVSVQSSCDVKSLTYCDLQCILLNKLKDTLVQYPEFAETFHEEIKHDLTYNLKEGFEEESEVTDQSLDIICSKYKLHCKLIHYPHGR